METGSIRQTGEQTSSSSHLHSLLIKWTWTGLDTWQWENCHAPIVQWLRQCGGTGQCAVVDLAGPGADPFTVRRVVWVLITLPLSHKKTDQNLHFPLHSAFGIWHAHFGLPGSMHACVYLSVAVDIFTPLSSPHPYPHLTPPLLYPLYLYHHHHPLTHPPHPPTTPSAFCLAFLLPCLQIFLPRQTGQ